MGQKFAAYNASGVVVGYYDDVDSPVPSGVSAIAISDAEWQSAYAAQPPYTVSNGVLQSPSSGDIAAHTNALAVAAMQQSAISALFDTRVTLERINEGVSLGTCSFTNADVITFMTYRKALRELCTNSTLTTLPIKPPFPAGT